MISFREAFVKFIVGGGLILLVSILGKSRFSFLSGILVLFPVVTVVGYYFLASTSQGIALQRIVLYSILSLPTVLAFLLVLYFTVNRMPITQSLILSILAWCLVAALIVFIDYKFIGLWRGL